MKDLVLSLAEALKFIERDEDHFFDHKALEISGAKVQKIAVAFANADGGEFIIGIRDRKDEPDTLKRWQGADNVEQFNGHLQALTKIKPSLRVSRTLLSCPELPGKALLLTVDKGPDVHETSDGTVYLRNGAQSLPVTGRDKILELKFAKGASSYEDFPVSNLNAEDVVDSKTLRNFVNQAQPSIEPLDFAINQNLVNRSDFTPNVAGILLFNDYPQPIMPTKCGIKIVRYETKEDEPERDHLGQQWSVEGPLYDQIHLAVQRIQEIMSSIRIWTTDGLQTVSYPPEAIWEILVNAVIHRDYSMSDDVQVLIYDNRIVVRSPGKLPGSVTLDNILDSRFARNSKIVRVLNKYPDPPNRDLGEGLNTAMQKMKDWKLKDPIFEENGNYFEVTIPHTPLAKPTELILQFLESNDEITNRQARELTGIRSENLVKIEFYKLRDAGLLEMVPGKYASKAAWRKPVTTNL